MTPAELLGDPRPNSAPAQRCLVDALRDHADGDSPTAAMLFTEMQQLRDADGSHWTEMVFTDGEH
ncbi:hypothetical protein [Nocardia pseudovaccinii]|uniref:hypothetical protein n=1 Tax=Nocardia pseudovaccinii TaxID=189540 RepID=UPI0007A55071|nr:hypothetical protein [Nocardia pseudovaccinii]